MVACLRGNATGVRDWFERNSPIAPVGEQRDYQLKEPTRAIPSGLGINPMDLVPTLQYFLKVSSSTTWLKFTVEVLLRDCPNRGSSGEPQRPEPQNFWTGLHVCGRCAERPDQGVG